MSGSIPAGSWQRTGEYHTRGVPVLHGMRWRRPLCVEEGVSPYHFFPVSLLQQDGILYVTYFVGGGESACCAIDAQSGTLRWRFTVADRTEDLPDSWIEAVTDPSRGLSVLYNLSPMVLTATTAFVGTTCGAVYGLDLSTGQPTWKIDVDELKAQLDEETWESDYDLDVQAVVGNLLLVSSGRSEIYAIDIVERTCLWQDTSVTFHSSLTLWDQLLYSRYMVDQHGGGSYIYYAYDWHRRQLVWQSVYYGGDEDEGSSREDGKDVPIEISMDGYLPLASNTLYVVGCKEPSWRSQEEEEEESDSGLQLMALDARTGEICWTYALDGFEFDGYRRYVTVANGLVYVSQGEHRCAVDLETHQLRWHHHQPAPPPPELTHSIPVLADGLWYECQADGVFLVLDALTGEERWTYRFEKPISINRWEPSCLVDDGSVYVIAGTTLYALH